MTKHLRSRDINSDLLVDKLVDPDSQIYIHKVKIAFGSDGVYTDVTLATPFPVTGTFTPLPPGFSNFGQGTPSIIPVTNVSTILLSANPDRVFARIINNSSQRIFIQYGIDAIFKQGTPLSPNGIFTVTTEELFLGQINAITNTGSVDIDVIEGVI